MEITPPLPKETETDALLENLEQRLERIHGELTTLSKIAPEDLDTLMTEAESLTEPPETITHKEDFVIETKPTTKWRLEFDSSFNRPGLGRYDFRHFETLAKILEHHDARVSFPMEDIALVMENTYCTREEATFALKKRCGDPVNAIMYLTVDRKGDDTPIIPEPFVNVKEAQVELIRALDDWKDRYDATTCSSPPSPFNVPGSLAVDVLRLLYTIDGVDDNMFCFFADMMNAALDPVNRELKHFMKNTRVIDTTGDRSKVSMEAVEVVVNRTGCIHYCAANALITCKNDIEAATIQIITETYEKSPAIRSRIIKAVTNGYDFEFPINRVELLMDQTACTFEQSVRALREKKNDIVAAILHLTII